MVILETLDGRRRREIGDVGQEDKILLFIVERRWGHAGHLHVRCLGRFCG
jgi:hypothetical protein